MVLLAQDQPLLVGGAARPLRALKWQWPLPIRGPDSGKVALGQYCASRPIHQHCLMHAAARSYLKQLWHLQRGGGVVQRQILNGM